MVRTIYCFRDPRDTLLSAMDHGKKALAAGESHPFVKLIEFADALQAATGWVRIWHRYADMPNVLSVRYEEMMQDPVMVTEKMEGFLGISVAPEKRQAILWRNSKDNPAGERAGMHFNRPRHPALRGRNDTGAEILVPAGVGGFPDRNGV
jgi:hypothetical protein